MVTVHKVEQGTEAWHELRKDKYTGSNAHKLLRFGAVEYARAQSTGFKGNFYTKRGHILEDEALELYGAIKHCSVHRPGFVTNSRYPSCGYSPDGIHADGDGWGDTHSGVLLECKAFNMARHKSIALGEIPIEIMAQIQFGMVITGLRKARLILYNPEFAKKEVIDERLGYLVPNPDYDPKMALIIKEVPYNRNVHSNFNSILIKGGTNATLHTQAAEN